MLRIIQLCSRLKQPPSASFPSTLRRATCRCHPTLTRQRRHARTYSSTSWNPNILKGPISDSELPKVSYNEFLWSRNERWPNEVGLVCGVTGQEVTFDEFRKQSQRFARSLLYRVELRPRQVLAVILPNILEFPPIVLGCQEAGIIPSLISPLSTPDEISYLLKFSEAKAVATFPGKLPELEKAIQKDASLKSLKIILTGNPTPNSPFFYFDNLQKNELNQKLVPASSDPNETIVLPFSSGTTGLPKGVCLTNKNQMCNALASEAAGMQMIANGGKREVVPLVLPMYHIYGLALLGSNIRCGSKTILLPKLEKETLLRSFTEHKASILYSATPLLIYLLSQPEFGPSEMSSIQQIVNAASPLSATIMNRMEEKMKRKIIFRQGYGLTETSPICTLSEGKSSDEYGSIGRPVLNTQMKVTDLETKQALSSNEIGEIYVKGPQVMKGYFKNEEETLASIDSDGWYHTGDLGYYDEKNLFFITGRIKELIKVKGLQVGPAEVEGALQTHPNVTAACVVGKPDDFKGETPVAFVVVKNEEEFDANQVKEFLADKLASYKIPSEIIPIKQMPVSNTGKFLKKELKKLL